MENGKPELTELERLKLENFALKHNAMQQQIQANLAERAAFIQRIEEAHPGFAWNEKEGLVAVAVPPSSARLSAVAPRPKP